MLQRKTIDNFKGVGQGQQPGEFYYGENLKPGQFGLEASLYLTALTASGNPDRLNWIVEFLGAVWGVDVAGTIFKESSNDWVEARNNGQPSLGNGLVVDQLGRLLYKGNQYLGMCATDGTTFTDNWKDMGSSVSDFSEMTTYEDWVVICHGNLIKVMSVLDDTPATGLTLPTDFHARCAKGNRNGILIGANSENRGVLLLWKPGYTRSLNEWIWLDAPIQAIAKAGDSWVITTTQEQYLTDGYSLTKRLPPIPDTQVGLQPYNVGPAGTLYSEGKILTFNTDLSGRYNRHKSGLWIQDLATDLHRFVPVAVQTELTTAALFKTSSGRILGSYSSTTPAAKPIVELRDDLASRAVLIAGPFGDGATKKVSQVASLGLSTLPTYSTVQKTKSFKVAAKIYNFKRVLWGYGTTNALSASAMTLKVNGQASGFNNARVGDEITILTGSDAGKVRHITAIATEDEASEVWTLDSALSGNTPSGITFQVMPFKLIETKTITSSSLDELEDLIFNIKNKYKGKRFLLKFVFYDIVNFPINIDHAALEFDDLETIA